MHHHTEPCAAQPGVERLGLAVVCVANSTNQSAYSIFSSVRAKHTLSESTLLRTDDRATDEAMGAETEPCDYPPNKAHNPARQALSSLITECYGRG